MKKPFVLLTVVVFILLVALLIWQLATAPTTEAPNEIEPLTTEEQEKSLSESELLLEQDLEMEFQEIDEALEEL